MYATIVQDIYSLIHNATFPIPVVPRDYTGDLGPSNEFMAVQIVFPNSEAHQYDGGKKISGMLFMDIYTKSGHGDERPAQLCDIVSEVFDNKTTTNNVQFFLGSVEDKGMDSANPSLRRSEYRVNFNYYGET